MRRFLSVLLIFLLMCGCAPSAAKPSADQTIVFTDALGREVSVSPLPARVAAMTGSFAELWTLAGGRLVGATDDAFDLLSLSDDVQRLGSLKSPSMEAVLSLDPDFVILSADIAGQTEISETLSSSGIAHAYFHVEEFTDYLDALKICTDLTMRGDKYEENGSSVQEHIDKVLESVKARDFSPCVLLLRAYSSGVRAKTGDNMTSIMLRELGCANLADKDASLLETLSLEAIIDGDPDYIFITTMGDSQSALVELEREYTSNPAWSQLSAVKSGHLFVLPPELFHNKPNARWGEAYAYLAKLLEP